MTADKPTDFAIGAAYRGRHSHHYDDARFKFTTVVVVYRGKTPGGKLRFEIADPEHKLNGRKFLAYNHTTHAHSAVAKHADMLHDFFVQAKSTAAPEAVL